MSIESAREFYQKVSTDEAFANQLRNAASDEQRRATIQAAGYDFTPEEWGTVVDQIKQSNDPQLSESQLEAVSGGLTLFPVPQPLPSPLLQPMYGGVS